MTRIVKTRRKIPQLKPDDVEDGDLGVIIGPGKRVVFENQEEDVLDLPIEINGVKYHRCLNAPSEDALNKAYGEDSVFWVGQSIKITKTKRGKDDWSLYLLPGPPSPQRQITQSQSKEDDKIFASLDVAIEARDRDIITTIEPLGDGRYKGTKK